MKPYSATLLLLPRHAKLQSWPRNYSARTLGVDCFERRHGERREAVREMQTSDREKGRQDRRQGGRRGPQPSQAEANRKKGSRETMEE